MKSCSHIRATIDAYPLIVVAIAVLSFLRVWQIRDVIWDDNFWLLSLYELGDLSRFLDSGFTELRRIPLGIYFFSLFSLYKDTEYFYPIWHAINTLTQLGSPLLLYALLNNLFPGKRELALFSAVAFIVFHADQTLPYASASNYRLGLMLTLLSLWLMERALRQGRWISGKLILSLLCGLISHSVFIEATVALEPARAIVIAYVLRNKTAKPQLLRSTLLAWLPYLLIALPLVIYKLANKTYGGYENMYHLDPLFFLNWRQDLSTLSHFLFFPWFLFASHLDVVRPATWLIGFIAFAGIYYVFYRSRFMPKLPAENTVHTVSSNRSILLLGIVAFLPAAYFFPFANLRVAWGWESSHAAIGQVGYAILLGWLLHRFYELTRRRDQRDPWIKFVFAGWLAIGVFFNNANLDHYLRSWETQSHFWNTFIQRFPSLPEKKYFIIDVRDRGLYSDFDNGHSLTLQLNLLYATSAHSKPFRDYRAQAIREWFTIADAVGIAAPPAGINRVDMLMDLTNYFGEEKVRPDDYVFVHYKDGTLLINHEIFEKYPQIPYQFWLKDPFPPLTKPSSHPLRYKMKQLSPDIIN